MSENGPARVHPASPTPSTTQGRHAQDRDGSHDPRPRFGGRMLDNLGRRTDDAVRGTSATVTGQVPRGRRIRGGGGRNRDGGRRLAGRFSGPVHEGAQAHHHQQASVDQRGESAAPS
ncbi:hypothetical protein [Promicromonospora soli]